MPVEIVIIWMSVTINVTSSLPVSFIESIDDVSETTFCISGITTENDHGINVRFSIRLGHFFTRSIRAVNPLESMASRVSLDSVLNPHDC